MTATNQAGSATQTSAPHPVAAGPAPAPLAPAALPRPAAFGARTLITLKLAAGRIAARGPLPVRVANGNDFAVTGTLSGQTTVSRRKRVKLEAKSFSLATRARKTIKLTLPRPLRRQLQRQRRLALGLTAKVKDPAGNSRTVTKRVTPKLKRKPGG